jgi:hypothetical protein
MLGLKPEFPRELVAVHECCARASAREGFEIEGVIAE